MIQSTVGVENVETTSKMSRYFRVLLKIGWLPLIMDSTEKKLSFKMCSRQTLYFNLYFMLMLAIHTFCIYYLVGADNLLKVWEILLNQSNFTDFLTYVVITSTNLFSALQSKFIYDISKISSDLLLSRNLIWPKHGKLLLFVSILCIIAQTLWAALSLNARIEMSYQQWIGIAVGNSILFTWNYIIFYNEFLFFLTWMEHFSMICENDSKNLFEKSQNCLQIYKTIQIGLEFIFLMIFIALQVMIVLNIYMFISTAFFGSHDLYTNIIMSICFVTIALYCAVVLYAVTTTAENTHSSLMSLANPLRKMMAKSSTKDERINIQILIKEIENTPFLHGCGYFELKRETLTSIVSNTVTYLIILLQFRTS